MTKSPLEIWFMFHEHYLQHTTTRVKLASKNCLGTKKIWVLFKPALGHSHYPFMEGVGSKDMHKT